MKSFKPSVLATLVTAALSSVAINANAVTYSSNQTALLKAPRISAQTSYDAARQQALASRSTISGMKSQFDTKLGKATFIWAPTNQAKPDLTGVAKSAQAQFAADFYVAQMTGVSANKAESNKAVVRDFHKTTKGPLIAKYTQEIQGVEVFNREYNIMMDRELNLVSASGYFARSNPGRQTLALLANFVSAEEAIHKAADVLSNGKADVILTGSAHEGKYQVFDAQSTYGDFEVVGQPRAKRVFFDGNDGLQAAYYVELNLADANSVESKYYSFVIDSTTQKVLFKKDLSAEAGENDFTYRVYANADGYPMEGPNGDVIPAAVPGNDPTAILPAPLVTLSNYSAISTNDPWLSPDATITSGNNVFAYADLIAPDGYGTGDLTAETTSAQTFDYVLKDSEPANSYNNRKAAVVNLFYMTNFLHDFYYDYGFDEAAGNAQLVNYDRGGVEGDPLHVQAQDFSGFDNANMSTPADGASPRMQQYLWQSKDAVVGVDFGVTVTSHADLGLLQSSKTASFGPQQFTGIEGDTVRLEDGTAPINDGCEVATNAADLAGKIAIIDRGACNFTLKVLHAQEAGAKAAIIVNNTDDGTPAPMGGEDAAVKIPSMGLNYADGHGIYDLIDAGDTVTVEMFNNFALKDSTFDNAVIAHEWGHYISNRLVGNASGLINNQGGSMGEGWGDFHAMMFLARAADAEIEGNEEFQVPYAAVSYVADYYYGIRAYPYTPNMDINPLTFDYITVDPEVHGSGTVWCSMLWDIYVGLINKYGFEEAQSRMATYLVASYKVTPVAPTFTEARDAVLATMYATDHDDFDLALKAFARRGMGLGAVSPERFDDTHAGVVESYESELATFNATKVDFNPTFDGTDLGYCTNDSILDAGETGTISVTIKNTGTETLTGVTAKVEVVGDQDVTFENDGIVTFDEIAPFASATSNTIKLTLNSAGTADDLELKVTFPEQTADDEIVEAPDMSFSTMVNMDFESVEPVEQTATSDMETAAIFQNWKEHVQAGGDLAEGTRVADMANTGFLQSLNPGVDLGATTMLIYNNDFESDVAYESNAFEVGYNGDFTVSFWHFYWIEEEWDGGVVEISVNGSDWVDVTDIGGVFENGYSGTLIDNPRQVLSGRKAFTGMNGDLATSAGGMESINFGTALNGSQVKLRFRLGSDSAAAEYGWFIDNVTISNVNTPVFSKVIAGDSVSCDNAKPQLTVEASASVQEGSSTTITAAATDRNGDNLTYSWVQTDGPSATVSGEDTETLTVTAPSVNSDTTLTFELTVSDGTDTVSSTVTVNVANKPSVVTPPKHSSGGSLGWLSIFLMLPLALRRRLKK
ncbi:rhombosortase-dependent M36 family metallopeptidase [Neptunicella marina]|uniref:Rhombosortase-dependent M36 family metallopeptidase n=1 Tax=Neptunicella marina TaxID=2125989 RepID=A0A8J6IWK3_9ALTE|nr:rhombosortase-dependent M36 family metallopeptidase [Neptunicella marina]MBC3767389.1 rhombosortase-dependent M36 family metallopeptidase [Neptunicella marina]